MINIDRSITYLDCTLRDGGYYNNWEFNKTCVNDLIKSLDKAGADIIELGYKSVPGSLYSGLYRSCNEEFLDFLDFENRKAAYAFMIDVKEFVLDDDLNYSALDATIKHASDSIFSWVRLAAHSNGFQYVSKFVDYFEKKGYKIGVNLMGGSLLTNDRLKEILIQVEKWNVDVFYLADSFGAFYPNDVTELVGFCKKYFSGTLGIHTHDNQGLAYANSLAAIEAGVDFVDGTVTGMGRGAGNLMTEQFLLGLSSLDNYSHVLPNSLLNVIQDYFAKMKVEYGWGYNYMYMLSGLNNIHQSYGQSLYESKKFTVKQISGILHSITSEDAKKYSDAVLKQAMSSFLDISEAQNNELVLPNLKQLQNQSTNCVIVSTGSWVKSNKDYICDFLNLKKWDILECNDSQILQEFERKTVVLNKMRLTDILNHRDDKQTIITSQKSLSSDYSIKGVFHQSIKISSWDISDDVISLKSYDSGQYCISLALKLGYKKIYLLGFDGYIDEKLNIETDDFFEVLKSNYSDLYNRIEFLSPTNYKKVKQFNLFQI